MSDPATQTPDAAGVAERDLARLEITTPAGGEHGRWFVFCKRGRPPRFEHKSEASAIAEATRLAGKTPGAKFHVLKSVARVRVAPAAASQTSDTVAAAPSPAQKESA